MTRLTATLVLAMLAGTATAQFTVVAPNGYSAAEGNSNNAYPWNRGASSIRVQCIYDSSNFTLQGVTSPILISQVKFRADAAAQAAWTGGTYGNLQVDVSTCPLDFAAASGTFASNHGPDQTTVQSGPFTILGGVGNGAGLPGPYHVVIPFSTPFLYDPTSGNDLCIDIMVDGSTWGGGTLVQCDNVSGSTTVPPPLGTRVYNTSGFNLPTGTVGLHYAAVGEFTYVPAAGLWPAFTATPRSGPVGTTVQFTDQSYSSDPLGVLAWAWDFDGDNVVDSTQQNPSHQYNTEGIYTVSLTVVDAAHPTATMTKTGFIRIDTVTASFTGNVLFGTTVQFTDTSTGGPTSWAWDFNGDNVIDSTVQNPAWVYPSAGSYRVTLTVTDAISSDTRSTNFGVGIIPMPGFGSTYSSATGTRGVWFQTPTRFSIVSLNVPDESNHGLQNVAVYRMTGAAPAYPATASGGLEFLQLGTPSSQTIPCALSFDAGEYVGLIAACGDATTMRTSYATPAGTFASSILGQPVTLTRFLTQTNLVTTQGTAPYSSEAAGAIGRVNIGISSCVGIAYGAGTPSGLGPVAPKLKTTALPFIGGTATLTVDNQDAGPLGILAIGMGRANIPTPVGTVLINNIGATFLINGGIPLAVGQNTFNFAVPNNAALNGMGPFTWQEFSLLPGGQIAMSNGNEWWLAL